jgi:glycosyltransferase involved in cell wall biosynthesis
VRHSADQNRDLPRISIITPCLNGERYIVDAVESVLRQGYPKLEHIVVDGASTDGTVAVLGRYAHLTVVSEPDQGSHEAMNKGVARSTGDVVAFLNVDDCYAEDTLHRVAAAFAANPGIEVVVGDMVVYEEQAPGRQAIRFIFGHRRGVWLTECLFGNPGINGCFFRRAVFEKIGSFNNDFYICADRDFLTRAALADVASVSLNATILWCRAHAGSRTINRARSNIVPIANELFRMASHFLATSMATGADRRLARAWQAFEAARLSFVQARHGQVSDAVNFLVGYSMQNPLWSLYLVRALYLRRIVRQNYRGGWNADIPAVATGQNLAVG